jgi:hypothetical protein
MILLATLSILFASHASATPEAVTSCIVMNAASLPLAKRQSPLDSVSFSLKGGEVKICYGRPSSRGRTMIGGENVPYGKLWRTGANEPTMIHTSVPLSIAGIAVPAGSYSIYTVPGPTEWGIIVNRSITQWGEEHGYTKEVQAQEVARATVPSATLKDPVETFTIRVEPAGADKASVVLEWEKTRVVLPVEAR